MSDSRSDDAAELIEHLKLIQGVVDRLARSSFAIKATASAVTAALIAVVVTQDNAIAGVGALSLVILWSLDAFYLSRERSYRALYELIRTSRPGRDDPMYFILSLNRSGVRIDGVLRTSLAPALMLFHPPLIIGAVLVAVLAAVT